MGCSCGSVAESRTTALHEALADPARYCAYPLDTAEPDHVFVYDFQTKDSRVLKLVANPALNDYTVYVNYPLLFMVGGVERETQQLSNKIWITSAGDDTVNMSSCRYLNEARKKPVIVSPCEGILYIVGGLMEDNVTHSKACERFRIGDEPVTRLKPMQLEHDCIFTVGKFIYGLGKVGSRGDLEVFDSSNEDKGWEIRNLIGVDGISVLTSLEHFGVVPADDSGDRILIFGGMNRNTPTATNVMISAKMGIVQLLKTRALPVPESFLMPTTSSKSVAYAVSSGFKLYVCEKKTGEWETFPTAIIEQVAKKGLHFAKAK